MVFSVNELRHPGSTDLAIITDIQRFSVHDGPGIRTIVFFKGCPLRCKWCHNPETIHRGPELIHEHAVCIGCGRCIDICKENAVRIEDGIMRTDRTKCTNCGDCTLICPAGARKVAGEKYSVEELQKIIIRDKVFFENSGGGVTLSGGEVSLQSSFAKKLIISLKEFNINTAIETCGYAAPKEFRAVAAEADLILFDIKHLNPEKHKKYTGVDTALIMSNLEGLLSSGGNVIARYPLIPTVNDSISEIKAVGIYCWDIGIKEIHVLPFQQAGETKWRGLDREYDFNGVEPMSAECINGAANVLRKIGLSVNIGGS